MKLYLVRHAHAVDETENLLRPLSAKGHAQMDALCTALRGERKDFSPDVLWHSPLVRARETAELLAKHLHLPAPLREVPGITPDDDPRDIAPKLTTLTETIAIVGHEPHLGMLAGLLINGSVLDSQPFRKGEVRLFEKSGARWIVRWTAIPPKS